MATRSDGGDSSQKKEGGTFKPIDGGIRDTDARWGTPTITTAQRDSQYGNRQADPMCLCRKSPGYRLTRPLDLLFGKCHGIGY